MQIDSIYNGIVIDHIKAGNSMNIYYYLQLNKLPNTVAVIQNVKSKKMGRKDIIKVEGEVGKKLDLLGFFDENITINIIKEGEHSEKKHPGLPNEVKGVISCKNPRCISVSEPELEQVFVLTNKNKREYRCLYCEQAHN